MIKDLVLMDYAAVMLTICLLSFIITNDYFAKRTRELFLRACFLLLVLVVADSIEYWTATFDHFSILRVWMSAIGYSLRPAIIYVIISLMNSREKSKKWMLVPIVINAFIAFSVLFTDVAYSYTADNQFVRGPIGYFAFVTSGIYLVVLFIYTYRMYRISDIWEMCVTFVAMAMLTISVIFESVLKLEGMINTMGAVTIVFYYLYLNTQQFKRDALTGVLNRRCFYLDAEKRNEHISAVISIDLNNLKMWNDEYGHAKGDEAIRAIVQCMQRALRKNCILYRTGGDEFMVLCFEKQRDMIEKMLKDMHAELEKTPYNCAIGVAYREAEESFQELCSRADQEMYENKARMKRG